MRRMQKQGLKADMLGEKFCKEFSKGY